MKTHEILAKLTDEERACVVDANERECQAAFERGLKAGREGSYELQRFREREPLVQAVMDALDDFEVFGRGGSYHIKGMLRLRAADKAVRDFGRCIVGASTDAPAAADLAHAESIGATESLKKAPDEP